ncbi:uncharacterized protein LOC122377914 [Amphibalanus amphitrite]|uniref:uncharacterized protein LOC122377914 n=1 Tax=Amphibalanus amphitrite TaxID=1232801 RepID=UPI001C9158A3|nr:uncharacterized protein LOC122377914 [Amphibalanus amphitrite]
MDIDIEKLVVRDLKRELDARGEDSRGTKAVLKERLAQVLREEACYKKAVMPDEDARSQADVDPESIARKEAFQMDVRSHDGTDARSVKSTSSRASVTSQRATEAARLAGLKAKMNALKQKHELEEQIENLRRKQEEVQLLAELKECEAKEAVLARFEALEHEEDDEVGNEHKQDDEAHESEQDEMKHDKKQDNETKEDRHAGAGRASHDKSAGSVQQMDLNTTDRLVMRRIGLQPLELRAFDGTEEDFLPFITAFQSNIACRLDREEEKLMYLLQLTKGKPHDIVATCVYLGDDGYSEAIRLLRVRYDNAMKSRASVIEKIQNYPRVRYEDVNGLDDYSVFLRGALNALHSPALADSGFDSWMICQAIQKTPWVADRWRRAVDRIEQDQRRDRREDGERKRTDQRQVSFRDFVEFIESEARIVSHPVYGRHVLSAQEKKDTRSQATTVQKAQQPARKGMKNREHQLHQERRSRAYASNMKQTAKCAYCEHPHDLETCRAFGAKTEEEKTDYIRQHGLCFGCLQEGHISKNCQKRSRCKKCEKSHPTSMHRDALPNANVVTAGHVSQECEGGGKLQVLPVSANVKERSVLTGAFIDPGSTHSFISRKLASQLGIQPDEKTYVVMSTINGERRMKTSLITGVSIGTEDGGNQVELPALYVLEHIPVEKQDIVRQEDISKWPHLRQRGVEAGFTEKTTSREIGLLIGANASVVSEPLEVVSCPGQKGPYAVRTRYGWLVCGVEGKRGPGAHVARVNRIKMLEDPELEFLDSHDSRRGYSVEDVKWCLKVEDTCKKDGEKYEIGLPFRDAKPDLPDNRVMAARRLESLRRKFEKDPRYAADYKEQMKKLLDEGYAEEAAPDSEEGKEERWYIPHHGVYHPTKNKLRVVFDCSASYNGVSLNDVLMQGPNLTNSLVDVLVRFRQETVAFTGDIESMFLQVMVPESDRNYLSFLWWPEGDTSSTPRVFRMTRHLFGATSSPSCANYALHRTAEDFGTGYTPEVKKTLQRSFYVDDVCQSTTSEASAAKMAQDLKQLCSMGGFRLTKFNSNSTEVLRALSEDDKGKTETHLGQETSSSERVLGVLWDTHRDELGFSIDEDALNRRPRTRRGILSATAACYDPLGLAAPRVLQGRMILQELTRLRTGWDDDIPNEVEEEWNRWLSGLKSLPDVRVPRCYDPYGISAADAVSLHHFSDASLKGYGTASYIRTVRGDGEVFCSLVLSRGRVAPLKAITVPRLELAAAKLAVDVNQELLRALDMRIHNVTFWTDSTTVLRYIENETSRYHIYVANRLAAIHAGSKNEQWRYVPSSLNPADMVSRGVLQDSDMWYNGPPFLRSSQENWPRSPCVGEIHPDDPEVKQAKTSSAAVVVQNEKADNSSANPIDRLIEYHSSWKRLTRAVVWIRRTIKTLQLKARDEQGASNVRELTPADIEDAERIIVKHVQKTHFLQELTDLGVGREVRCASRPSRLSPFVEDGLIRMRGRLMNSALDWAAKHPLILPDKDKVTDLIIADRHERAGHEGRQYVLSELRTRYWVLKGNSAVRRCLHRCVKCRRRQRPVEGQKMADLPQDRVEEATHPFSSTGVDYFGPLYAKRGRGQVKKFGVIFTCLSTRAVHLELADNLSADSFICALRRFIARRGNVRLMRSDRGTNFTAADKELKEEVDALHANEEKLRRAMLDKGIEWMFNVPAASHHGGVWERLIRGVRKILNGMLTSQTFTEETLHTLLCETECIMNNRPLVPVSSDPRDEVPLTPNHILHLKCVTPVCDSSSEDDLDGPKRWRQAAYLAEQFWRSWRRLYLPLLQQRSRAATRSRTNLRIGDVVVMVDESVPRGVWPLGLVKETLMGKDGRVRSVKVRARETMFLRPVTKVVKILGAEEQSW